MSASQFCRTARLLGSAAMQRLASCRVAVFGIGGVGGYAVEALARSGVGGLSLFDGDVVSESNLNRQIIALHSTLGERKVDVAARRVADINPECRVTANAMFYLPSNADEVDLSQFDIVLDCVDTMAAKLELARRCTRLGVPIVVSMGAANKLDPTAFRVDDLSRTSIDPLARIMRKKLRKEGIEHLPCVWSPEPPVTPVEDEACAAAHDDDDSSRQAPASNAWVPAAAGLLIASHAVKMLCGEAASRFNNSAIHSS